MKKLTLKLDELSVESFEIAAPRQLRGTVRGHGDSSDCSYGSPMYTACDLSCEFECGQSGECTPACPGGSGTCGGGGSTDPTCETACDLSCEFAC